MKQKHYIAGLYYRLFQEDERQGESVSIDNQRAILRKYAEERGFEIHDEYIDDAYIRIINTGYIPTDYQDIKEVILKNIVAVKIEREHRRVSVDKVDYKLTDHEDDI